MIGRTRNGRALLHFFFFLYMNRSDHFQASPPTHLTTPLRLLFSFGFWGIDFVTRELEDPYGMDKNDLDIKGVVADVFATIDDDFNIQPTSYQSMKSMTYNSTGSIASQNSPADVKTPLV